MIGKRKVSEYYPELVKFFKFKNEADECSIRSDRRIWVKCPDCGYEHVMIVKNLTRRHYRCPMCGDGISFPEKLVLGILEEQGINYIHHLNKRNFSWCDKYIYDFYLPEHNIIIEVDGSQHTTSSMGYKQSKSLEEEQKNDKIKESIALTNGIERIVRVDFSNSDILVLKKVVCDSLEGIIDPKKINWKSVVAKACRSQIYEACQKWENEKKDKNTAEIAKELGISRDKLVKYLHLGTEAGYCLYDGAQERIRAAKKGGEIIKKMRTNQVLVFSLSNEFLGEFPGARYLSEHSQEIFGTKFDYAGIVYTCNGEQKTHRGFIFKYKKDVLFEP